MRQQALPAKQAANALVTALFLMTLIAISATAITLALRMNIYKTQLTITKDRLYLASQIVTFWAMDQLKKPTNTYYKADKQGKVASFPTFKGPYPIKGDLYDLQSHLNFNNLSDSKQVMLLMHLISNIAPKIKGQEKVDILHATYLWISPYQPDKGKDPFLEYYRQFKPPYLPAYHFMASASEFRLIKGVSATIYEQFLPYITVLPEITPININTAPPILLKILGRGLNNQDVAFILDKRGNKGIKKVETLKKVIEKFSIPTEQVTIESSYFMSIAYITYDEMTLTHYSIFQRKKDKKGKITVSLITDTLNTV